MDREEMLRLEGYLKQKLNGEVRLVARKEDKDSAEIFLGQEFIAVAYKDEDDGEVSYAINMTVLAEDLTLD